MELILWYAKSKDSMVHIDEQGKLGIPKELADLYGLSPGRDIRVRKLPDSIVSAVQPQCGKK